MRPGERGEPHGEPADPAGRPGDQHPPAEHRAARPQRPQRRDAGHWKGRRLREVHHGRHLGQRAGVDDDLFGEPARRQRHHPGAGRRAARARPQHDPRDVRTEHRPRRHTPRPGIVQIPVIQRGVPHLNQYAVAGGDWLDELGQAHRLGHGRIHHERTHLKGHSSRLVTTNSAARPRIRGPRTGPDRLGRDRPRRRQRHWLTAGVSGTCSTAITVAAASAASRCGSANVPRTACMTSARFR